MGRIFDVMVAGLGANGSSALYYLSKGNKNIIGVDRFKPPHSFGSSHGQSRIIRQAYYENPVYVPFIKEAYRLWHEIEAIADKKLLLKTGGMMLGNEHASVIAGSIRSASLHDIDFEYLSCKDIKRRFPAFKPTADTVGVLEKDAGILYPEECIRTYLEEAKKNGAVIQYNETVLAIKANKDAVEVTTNKATYTTGKIIISAGAWVSELLPELNLPLTIERQVVYWFKNRNAAQQRFILPQNMPVYVWEYFAGKMFYGFPDLGDGIKIACHHAGKRIKPDELNQEVTTEEIDSMKNVIDRYLDVDAVFNNASVCIYTNTPDLNFIIDYHPGFNNVIIASPCSGHGFKFSSLTGKLLSDMAKDATLDFDITPFSIARFSH